MSDPVTAQPSKPLRDARARHTPRHHLVDRLDGVLAARAGVVCGPAGSGKTTLVRSWATRMSAATVAYVRARPEHRDAQVLLAAIVESLRATGIIEHITPIADAAVLAEAIDAADARVVVVIDEVEALQGSESATVLDRLVASGGTSLRVVVAGRSIDDLELGEFRRNAELIEVTAADLRLTRQETIDVVRRVSDTDATDDVLATIHEQTDGWTAGAVLAGLVLRERGATGAVLSDLAGSHHFDGFLERHVFAELPDDTRQFLLDTCVLDPLFADQCRELTGRDDADRMLRRLERSHVFTEWIGGELRAFRYHPLLRSWLIGRLPESRRRELCRRASAWSSRQQRPAEAIEYLLDAHEIDAAVDSIIEYGPQALAEGRYEALMTWIGAIPRPLAASNADLLALGLEVAHRFGSADAASLTRTLSLCALQEAASDDATEARTRLTIDVQRMRELFSEGRLTSAGQHARRAFCDFDTSAFERDPHGFTIGDLAVATDVNVCATQLMFAGHLSESILVSEWVVDNFAGPLPVQAATVANALGTIALCELLRHQREPALERAREALALCRFHQIDPADLGWAEATLSVAGSETERSYGMAAIERRLRRVRFPAYSCLGGLFRAWSSVLAHDPRSARLDLVRAESAIASMPEPAVLTTLARRVKHVVERNADEPELLERHRAVLVHLAAGRSRREAADELHLSVNTIKTYARLAYRSLGVCSLDEAVTVCDELGISLDAVDRPTASADPTSPG